MLCSGSRDRHILQRDIRCPEHFTAKLVGHRSEVCGLKVRGGEGEGGEGEGRRRRGGCRGRGRGGGRRRQGGGRWLIRRRRGCKSRGAPKGGRWWYGHGSAWAWGMGQLVGAPARSARQGMWRTPSVPDQASSAPCPTPPACTQICRNTHRQNQPPGRPLIWYKFPSSYLQLYVPPFRWFWFSLGWYLQTPSTQCSDHATPTPSSWQWSPDDRQLASGGNDNQLYIWSLASSSPQIKFSDHTAAVKVGSRGQG